MRISFHVKLGKFKEGEGGVGGGGQVSCSCNQILLMISWIQMRNFISCEVGGGEVEVLSHAT